MYWLKYSVVSNTVIVKADTATVENWSSCEKNILLDSWQKHAGIFAAGRFDTDAGHAQVSASLGSYRAC